MFAEPALVWDPATARPEAVLTDVFPRDEFYLNNGVTHTLALRRTEQLLGVE